MDDALNARGELRVKFSDSSVAGVRRREPLRRLGRSHRSRKGAARRSVAKIFSTVVSGAKAGSDNRRRRDREKNEWWAVGLEATRSSQQIRRLEPRVRVPCPSHSGDLLRGYGPDAGTQQSPPESALHAIDREPRSSGFRQVALHHMGPRDAPEIQGQQSNAESGHRPPDADSAVLGP